MIQHYLSIISQDDNPRLHRVPFLMLWVASYGLAWLLIYIYEHPLTQELCGFSSWLRGGWQHTTQWREDLFIGLLVGLTLSIMQTWLLKQRYGYAPKYWRTATLIGAILGGFGYARIGGRMGPVDETRFIGDFFIWFITMNVFQAVVMFRTNRQAWWIGLIGIASAGIAAAIVSIEVLPPRYVEFRQLAVVIATTVQSIGTGLVILYAMANPRYGTVPKRDDSEKPKRHFNSGISPTAFVALWITVYFIAQSLILLIHSLYSKSWYWIITLDIHMVYHTYHPLILLPIFGIILAMSQQWVIKQLTGQTIRYWARVTVFAWFTVGVVVLLSPNTYNLRNIQSIVLSIACFTIPTLLQAFLMRRMIPCGSLWVVSGLVAGILTVFLFKMYSWNYVHYFANPMDMMVGGLVLSIVTALTFLWLMSHPPKTEQKSDSWERSNGKQK